MTGAWSKTLSRPVRSCGCDGATAGNSWTGICETMKRDPHCGRLFVFRGLKEVDGDAAGISVRQTSGAAGNVER